MRNVALYIAASLDNYIAKPDGNIDWLNDPDFFIEGEDFGYHSFYDSIDTTLMGNSTYQEILGFDVPFPYPDKTNYVFSMSEQKNNEHVKFIHSGVPEFVRRLKEQPGKDIWLVGGGQVNTLLLDHDLIDKIILTIMPLRLGDGIPLFAKSPISTKFKLESSQSYSTGVVQLVYLK